MADVLETKRQITLEEFERRFLRERVELVDGRIEELPMTNFYHTTLVGWLNYLLVEKLPGVTGPEAHLRLGSVVRLPDLCWWSPSNIPPPEERTGTCGTIPELAVEVVSPDERSSRLLDKVALYLAHGVKQVWLIYPEQRLVQIHRGRNAVEQLAEGDTIEGGEALGGLELPIDRIFEPLDRLEAGSEREAEAEH